MWSIHGTSSIFYSKVHNPLVYILIVSPLVINKYFLYFLDFCLNHVKPSLCSVVYVRPRISTLDCSQITNCKEFKFHVSPSKETAATLYLTSIPLPHPAPPQPYRLIYFPSAVLIIFANLLNINKFLIDIKLCLINWGIFEVVVFYIFILIIWVFFNNKMVNSMNFTSVREDHIWRSVWSSL